MTGLLGPNGLPISSKTFQNKKADPPKTGPAFGAWAGREDLTFGTLPGGGIVQFDLSKLTLQDFRTMRDHYQVNASLSVLTFMQHQSDFHIECDNKKIRDHVDADLRENWTMLNRAMATSNWSGFAPAALEWKNDLPDRKVYLDKVKDLIPEECVVNWKTVDGWSPPNQTPPKFKVYDGIKQYGQRWPIPVENSFWYPLLMENGNYYGRKLLRPAFQSWFFSILLHLYANRYYERFGEPTPVGRAPYDELIDMGDGSTMQGNVFMLQMLQRLRSRGVVVLPNEKTQDMNGRPQFDYDIQYLESQMRGADFERYMTRLDEEISIGLFTPILLMRTADVGSYNLGQGHERIYQIMLNAMNDDRKKYIDHYIINKMVDYNFGVNAPRAKIVFRKFGLANTDIIKELITNLVSANKAKVDLVELGQMAGMTITEVKETLADPATDSTDPAADAPDATTPKPAAARATTRNLYGGSDNVSSIATEINTRVRGQIDNAFKGGNFGPDLRVNMGFKRRMEQAFHTGVADGSEDRAEKLYARMDNWLADIVTLGPDEFGGTDDFMGVFSRVLENEIKELVA